MAERASSYGAHGEPALDRVLASLRRRQVQAHVPAGGVAVDLGCGFRGDLLRRLAPRIGEGIGLDVAVQEGRPAPNVRLEAARVDGPLPLDDGVADLVTCLAVIEHVEHPDVLLGEAHRILRPGGTLVLTTPSRQAKPVLELLALRLRLIDPAEILDHERYYSPAGLRADLEAAGFPRSGVRVSRFEAGLNLRAVATRAGAPAGAPAAP